VGNHQFVNYVKILGDEGAAQVRFLNKRKVEYLCCVAECRVFGVGYRALLAEFRTLLIENWLDVGNNRM